MTDLRVIVEEAEPRRLYVVGVDDAFDSDRDRVLGPWCFIDAEDRFPQWEFLDFIEPFEDKNSIEEASRNCAVLARYHIDRLTRRLNATHDSSHGFAYWWTILTPWLLLLIEASWRHWVCVQQFIVRHERETLEADIFRGREDVIWDFTDTREFLDKGLRSRRFVYWLLSEYLNLMKPAHWRLTPSHLESPATDDRRTLRPPESSNLIKRVLRRELGGFMLADTPSLSIWNLGFSLYLHLLPRRHLGLSFHVEPTENLPSYFPNGYLAILDQLISRTMPRSFRNDFPRLEAEAAEQPTFPGRIRVTAPAIWEDGNNFRLARSLQKGERLVRVQHGSGYGVDAASNTSWLNEYIDTAFLTWGWTEQATCTGRFVPIPDPALSRLRNRHRQSNHTIIFVGTRLTVVPFAIGASFGHEPARTPGYRRAKIEFVGRLADHPRSKLVYRPYKRSVSDLDEDRYLADRIPGLKIHDGDLNADMLRCTLLVIDHPGTTLNIAMAANVPTVCYWDPRLYRICEQAEPFFAGLREVGILFDGSETAAMHVNTIFADVQSWWRGEMVQAARRAWANQFARSSHVWWLHWLRALRQI